MYSRVKGKPAPLTQANQSSTAFMPAVQLWANALYIALYGQVHIFCNLPLNPYIRPRKKEQSNSLNKRLIQEWSGKAILQSAEKTFEVCGCGMKLCLERQGNSSGSLSQKKHTSHWPQKELSKCLSADGKQLSICQIYWAKDAYGQALPAASTSCTWSTWREHTKLELHLAHYSMEVIYGLAKVTIGNKLVEIAVSENYF